jgi:hypothetical protein
MSRIWQNFPKKIKNKIQIRKKIPKNSQISLLRKQTKIVLKKKKKKKKKTDTKSTTIIPSGAICNPHITPIVIKW